jgi:hypothetical protein
MKPKKCEHKWVDMENGSRDKFCVRCSNKAKQAVNYLPLMPSIADIGVQPAILRETVTINMGGHLGSVDVYKDKILDEISKSLRLSSRALR